MREKLLTPVEAAEQLNVNPAWFKYDGRWEKFDTIKLSNGAYRIPQSSIDRYLRKNTMRDE